MIEVSIATDTLEQLVAVFAQLNPSTVNVFNVCMGGYGHSEDTEQESSPAITKTGEQTDGSVGEQKADVPTPATPVQEATVQPTTTVPVADKPVRKAGRPKKTDTTVESEETPATTVTTEQAVTEMPSIDDVRAAMTRISETVGILAVKALLEKFAVKRIGDLDPAKYSEFLAVAAEVKA